jgi:uncharacterized protein
MTAVRIRVQNLTRQSLLAEAAELASTFLSRGRGLLGRDGLEPGGGMWIVPGDRIHMCGMRFAIDVVFVSREHRVTAVHPAVEPQPRWAVWRTWGGGRGGHSVLELPPGTIGSTHTDVGDQLQIERHG